MVFLIVSLVVGLYFLISGKVKLGKNVYLEGARARIAGLIFLMPVVLTLVLVSAGIAYESTGRVSDPQAFERTVNSLATALMMDFFLIGLAYINYHSVSRETKERGGCLSYGLAYFVFSSVMVVYFSLNGLRSGSSFIGVMIGISILQILCILGIWLWKKWGLFGFAFVSLVAPIVAYLNTGSFLSVVISLLQSLSLLLVLYLLVRPKWQFFA